MTTTTRTTCDQPRCGREIRGDAPMLTVTEMEFHLGDVFASRSWTRRRTHFCSANCLWLWAYERAGSPGMMKEEV